MPGGTPYFSPVVSTQTGAIDAAFVEQGWSAQLLDLYDPMTRYNMFPKSMSSFMEMFMTKDYVAGTTIKNVEKNPPIYQAKVSAAGATAGGAGLAVWVPLHASSQFTSGKFKLPKKGYTMLLNQSGVTKSAYVVDVDNTANAQRIQLKPYDITLTITLAANAIMQVVPASMVASGNCEIFESSHPLPGVTFTSTLFTAKKHLVINGEELASYTDRQFLFPVTDIHGKTVNYWWSADLSLLYEEFEMAKYRWRMLGEKNTNTGFGGKGSDGFITAVEAGGQSHNYTGTFDMADFEAVAAKFVAERVNVNNFAVWAGYNLRYDLDKVVDAASFGRITWNVFGTGMQDKFVDFGFSGVKVNGKTFYFNEEENFSDPGFLGATGWNYTDTGIIIPLDSTTTQGNRVTTFFENLYQRGNGYSRELEMRNFGKLDNPNYQGTCDNHTWEVDSTLGFRMHYRHAFMKLNKTA